MGRLPDQFVSLAVRARAGFAAGLVFLALVANAPALAGYDAGVAALRTEDYAGAMRAWSEDADKDPRSQYSIGYLHQFGLGVAADPAVAKSWYEKAAAAKNADALYALGLMAETAKLGPRDLGEAMRYYREAAAQGPHPDAEYALGRMILRGRGVARDPVEALKWLKLAAQHGHPAGQYMLGEAFEAGWGVPASTSEALYWYRLAEKNDAVELGEHDLSFQPKLAIETLKKRMSAESIRAVEARLKALKDTPAKAAETVKAANAKAEPPKTAPTAEPKAEAAAPPAQPQAPLAATATIPTPAATAPAP